MYTLYFCTVIILLVYFRYYIQKYTMWVFGFQHIWEISIDNIPQNLKWLLLLIAKELKTFDCNTIRKETHRQRLCFFKFVHSIFRVNLGGSSLRLQARIELLHSTNDSVNIYLARETILVISLFDCLFDLLLLQLPLNFWSHPL